MVTCLYQCRNIYTGYVFKINIIADIVSYFEDMTHALTICTLNKVTGLKIKRGQCGILIHFLTIKSSIV